MNWGRILTITMGLFIIMIVAMGVKMATSNEALYEKDYYEQGEKHAERMELEQVGQAVKINYLASENAFAVAFDSVGYIQEIKLIHLAGADDDRIVKPIDNEPSATKFIALTDLKSGVWVLEAKGEVNGEPFFIKKQFVK
ncbi:MAG: FixH [Bacteroidota bacterium]|jgi:hypothetical protein